MSQDDRSDQSPAPDGDDNLVDDRLPEPPEEFAELQMIKACHPSLFLDQATLLRNRFEAFLKVGFTEDQALQLILRWGLKKNLTDS